MEVAAGCSVQSWWISSSSSFNGPVHGQSIGVRNCHSGAHRNGPSERRIISFCVHPSWKNENEQHLHELRLSSEFKWAPIYGRHKAEILLLPSANLDVKVPLFVSKTRPATSSATSLSFCSTSGCNGTMCMGCAPVKRNIYEINTSLWVLLLHPAHTTLYNPQTPSILRGRVPSATDFVFEM